MTTESENFEVLTLDTSTVQKEGFRFDEGNLRLLRQFHGSPIKVVFSSIIVREITAHLEDAIKGLRNTLKSADKDAMRLLPGLGDIVQRETVDALDPREAAISRLTGYMSAVDAQEVGAAWADLTKIEHRYFQLLAPFTGQGNKKHEFPDAIALSSIEAWAKANGKKIVAVSEDKGWMAYKSDVIKVVPTILEALEFLLPKPEDKAIYFVAEHIKNLAFDATYDYAIAFSQMLGKAIDNTEFSVEADSDLGFELDTPEVKITGFEVDKEFTIVQVGAEEIVANLAVSIETKVSVQVDFFVWDGVDKEMIAMGIEVFERSIRFEGASLLVTFNGDFSTENWIVAEVEISDIDSIIDLGYVTPNWIDDPEPD